MREVKIGQTPEERLKQLEAAYIELCHDMGMLRAILVRVREENAKETEKDNAT